MYHSAYNHPKTQAYIKDWASRKNYHLLGDKTPELTEADYRKIEDITSGIELADGFLLHMYTALPCHK